MGYCPTQAIEVSYLLGVGAYLAAAAVPATALWTWLAARVPAPALLGGVSRLVLETLLGILVLGLVYPLFHSLLSVPWINRLFTIATPTHYYRRYHEPDTTLRDLD
jgi:hypothetical protein